MRQTLERLTGKLWLGEVMIFPVGTLLFLIDRSLKITSSQPHQGNTTASPIRTFAPEGVNLQRKRTEVEIILDFHAPIEPQLPYILFDPYANFEDIRVL